MGEGEDAASWEIYSRVRTFSRRPPSGYEMSAEQDREAENEKERGGRKGKRGQRVHGKEGGGARGLNVLGIEYK